MDADALDGSRRLSRHHQRTPEPRDPTSTPKTRDGWTPLHEAACEGHAAAIEALIRRGATLNASNEDIGTPLHAAALEGHPVAIEALLAGGANANATNKIVRSTLREAAYNFHSAAIEALLVGGANVNAMTDTGLTPIDAAQFGTPRKRKPRPRSFQSWHSRKRLKYWKRPSGR